MPGLHDVNFTAIDHGTLHSLHRLLGVAAVREPHEAKATAHTSAPVAWDVHVCDAFVFVEAKGQKSTNQSPAEKENIIFAYSAPHARLLPRAKLISGRPVRQVINLEAH